MKKQAVDVSKKSSQSSLESVPLEKYLTFFIDEQLFAIPSSKVMEIIRMQPITYMPKMPQFVKGIINLRGRIVPLIDLASKFGKAVEVYDDRTSIIVVETSDFTVGLIVAAVNDVTDISKGQISESPTLSKSSANRFVTGIATLDNAIAMILDIEKVLEDTVDEPAIAESAAKAAVTEAD